jgi:CubicO group peptidase (beta-lactamase class C family)
MRMGFSGVVLSWAAWLLVTAVARAASPAADAVAAWAETAFPAHLAERKVAGATLAVVLPDGVTVLRGFGVADAASGRAVDPQRTAFMLGSVSKVFTAMAAVQLVEQGKLSLDEDINTVLRGWRVPDRFGAPVTLRHLLTHTAGFAELSRGTRAASPETVLPLRVRFATTPSLRERPPGERSAYTNYNFSLAGLLVEEASGEDYASYVERHLFAPLGMTRSYARQTLPSEILRDLAVGHTRSPGGSHLAQPREIADPIPSGGLVATAADMARFARAVLAGGELDGRRVLRADTMAAMLAPQHANEPRAGALGFGWWLTTEHGRPVASHGGRNVNFRSGLWLLPGADVGVFIAVNGVQGSPDALWSDFLRRFYPVEEEARRPLEAARTTDVRTLAGVYTDRRFGRTSALRLMDAFLATPLTVGASGRLQRYGTDYVEVEPLVFAPAKGGGARLFFAVSSDTPSFVEEGVPPVRRERLARSENLAWHRGILGAAGAVLVLVPLAWGGAALWRVWRRRREPASAPSLQAADRWAMVAALLALAGIALFLGGGNVRAVYYYGLTPILRGAALLPALALLPAAVGIRMLCRESEPCGWRRAVPAAVFAAVVTVAGEAAYWNWLGGMA